MALCHRRLRLVDGHPDDGFPIDTIYLFSGTCAERCGSDGMGGGIDVYIQIYIYIYIWFTRLNTCNSSF